MWELHKNEDGDGGDQTNHPGGSELHRGVARSEEEEDHAGCF